MIWTTAYSPASPHTANLWLVPILSVPIPTSPPSALRNKFVYEDPITNDWMLLLVNDRDWCPVVPSAIPIPDLTCKSKILQLVLVPIPTNPVDPMRTLSLPPVSNETVSAAGNLIAVFVSPVWIILSAIDTSPAKVLIPATFNWSLIVIPEVVVTKRRALSWYNWTGPFPTQLIAFSLPWTLIFTSSAALRIKSSPGLLASITKSVPEVTWFI